jgi:hypothetical protein
MQKKVLKPVSTLYAFIVSLLGMFGYTSTAAAANSCANVDVIGTFDRSGLQESEYGINAAGTFRIADEGDEGKQPLFNLATIHCENQSDYAGRVSLECKLTQAVMWSHPEKPNTDNPNCSLDLDSSEFSMKELQKGILVGGETSASTSCYNTMLTIDRNTKRVYLSFTRTKYADTYDKTKAGTCGAPPRTQVLMNCTGWAGSRMRKHGQTPPPRYCDFSSSSDE